MHKRRGKAVQTHVSTVGKWRVSTHASWVPHRKRARTARGRVVVRPKWPGEDDTGGSSPELSEAYYSSADEASHATWAGTSHMHRDTSPQTCILWIEQQCCKTLAVEPRADVQGEEIFEHMMGWIVIGGSVRWLL